MLLFSEAVQAMLCLSGGIAPAKYTSSAIGHARMQYLQA